MKLFRRGICTSFEIWNCNTRSGTMCSYTPACARACHSTNNGAPICFGYDMSFCSSQEPFGKIVVHGHTPEREPVDEIESDWNRYGRGLHRLPHGASARERHTHVSSSRKLGVLFWVRYPRVSGLSATSPRSRLVRLPPPDFRPRLLARRAAKRLDRLRDLFVCLADVFLRCLFVFVVGLQYHAL